MVTSYAGFRADDVGLMYYGTPWRYPTSRRARLAPSGLCFVPDVPQHTPLAWTIYLPEPPGYGGTDSNPTGWWIAPGFRIATRVHIETGRPNERQSINLVDPFPDQFISGSTAGDVLQALCQYLSETPPAQAGLGDPGRCARLVDGLRSTQLRGAVKRETADGLYIGQRGGIRQTLDKVVLANVRMYHGRPVAGDPKAVAAMAAEWTSRTPWPFGVLATG